MDQNTRIYDYLDTQRENAIRKVLESVYISLEEKEYRAIDQMVGYILSGDPTYITSHNNARNIIRNIDRDDILEELIKAYLKR